MVWHPWVVFLVYKVITSFDALYIVSFSPLETVMGLIPR